MTLLQAVRDLDTLDKESTLYAAKPWTENSLVIVALEPDSGGLPASAQELGLMYFLEVFIACDLLEGWAANLREKPTLQMKCARLIQYAIADA